MASQSQCLDDDALRGRRPSMAQVYSEVNRPALEELLATGHPAFHAFLRREKAGVFLSGPESRARLSLAYFPARSDVEPPALELGWPAASGSCSRGPTEVETFFHPGFDGTVYPCKAAVRRQIRSAKEVIAIVMDIFTDIDIFSDLLEACQKRRIRVYIPLDETFFLYFLKMCHDFGIDLENEKVIATKLMFQIL